MKTKMKKWLSLLLTAVMLFGTFALIIPAAVLTASAEDYTNVPANTTVNVNGVNIRYDRYSGNDDGYVHVMPNGTIEFKIRHGDMVWFPDIVMTDSTAVHGEVTVISGTNQHSGFAYNVAKDGDSWASTMIVGYNNGARVRIAGDTKANLGIATPGEAGCYGSGGASVKPLQAGYINQGGDTYRTGVTVSKNASVYNNVKNVNNEVAVGKTVGVNIKKSSGTVSVDWLGVDIGVYYSATYPDTVGTVTPYAYAGGSVGYSLLYQPSGNEYIVRRIEALDLTNCKVNGADTAAWSAVGKIMQPHTDTVVGGVTYRFDPLKSSTLSSCRIMADNTFRLHISAGDLFWMPGTENAAGGTMTAKMIANNGQLNSGNLAAGIAYHINLGANGTWGDSSDSFDTAHLQTSWRRRIISSTVAGVNTTNTKLGIQSTNTLAESDRNAAYLSFGDRWNTGDVLKTVLSINNSGDVYASFQSEDGTEMNYDYYVPEQSGDKVLDGPIGFIAFRDGDGSERLPMVVDILSMTPDYTGVKNIRANLSLDGTIKANVAFSASTYVANNANLVVTKAGEEIKNVALDTLWNATEKAYVVSIPVAAKEMTDEINVCVKIGGDVVSGSSYTFTVKQLAEATASAYTDWADVMSTLLTYGAAAQKQFDYNTADPASSATPVFDASSIGNATVAGDPSFVSSAALTLSLESGTDLNLYFKPVDEGKTVSATAIDQKGAAVTLATESVDGFFAVRIKNLPAEDLTTLYTVTVTCEGASFDITFSAMNWVKSVLADQTATENEENLAKAIGAYASAVAQKKN